MRSKYVGALALIALCACRNRVGSFTQADTARGRPGTMVGEPGTRDTGATGALVLSVTLPNAASCADLHLGSVDVGLSDQANATFPCTPTVRWEAVPYGTYDVTVHAEDDAGQAYGATLPHETMTSSELDLSVELAAE